MQQSANISSLFETNVQRTFFSQFAAIFPICPSKVEKLKTYFALTLVQNYCISWKNSQMPQIMRKYEHFTACKSTEYHGRYDILPYLFCPTTCTKFQQLHHSYHVIPHHDLEMFNWRHDNKVIWLMSYDVWMMSSYHYSCSW